MLCIVDGYDKLSRRDRGDVSPSDEIFGCDAISSIYFKGSNSALADARKDLDDLLVELRHGCKFGDAILSETTH